ncbi:MAG: phenylalanine--tRNA ligase subunit beta, partial [Sarcina sp.]
PNLAQLALDRACALIDELGYGDVMEGTIDIYNEVKTQGNMSVDVSWVNGFLGTELTSIEMKKYLDSLDLQTTVSGDVLDIIVPTFRIDVAIKQDIAEEIARIYGYNNIPTSVITTSTDKEHKSEKQKLDDLVIKTMISSGLNQSVSYSFGSVKAFDMINLPTDSELRNVVRIKNPLGEDFSVMRTSILPSMMESLARNYTRNNEFARLFEVGKVYIPNEDENELPTEKNILTIGLYGDADYFDLKGIVENLIAGLGINKFSFKRESENPSYHPGKTAVLTVGKNVLVGVLGEVHPDVTENYGVDTLCYTAELDLDALYSVANTEKKYAAIPKFPAVTRDIALLVDDEVLVADIEDTIKKAGQPLVESIKLFDVYKGEQIPEGKKSIAYAIVYRDPNKTLEDKAVNKVHDKILRALEHKLGAELR